MTAALPAAYMVLTGATVGLIFGVIVKPRTVEKPKETRSRRLAICAGVGAAGGLVVALLSFVAVGVN